MERDFVCVYVYGFRSLGVHADYFYAFLGDLYRYLYITYKEPMGGSCLTRLGGLLFLGFVLCTRLEYARVLRAGGLRGQVPHASLHHDGLSTLVVTIGGPTDLLRVVVGLPMAARLTTATSRLPRTLRIFGKVARRGSSLVEGLHLVGGSLLRANSRLVREAVCVVPVLGRGFPNFVLLGVFLRRVQPMRRGGVVLPTSASSLRASAFPFGALLVVQGSLQRLQRFFLKGKGGVHQFRSRWCEKAVVARSEFGFFADRLRSPLHFD